ncbi:hypothetical protein HOA92_05245 [archaeon]|jgi:hypothetical protein|nr:hypothetical protein [archaeon]MBT6762420.1 hypothetical protein [archaeon]
MAIGFGRKKEKDKVVEVEIEIENVEEVFKEMMVELAMEEELHEKAAKIEEKIRKELSKLYKRVKILEVKIRARDINYSRVAALIDDNPKKALKLLDDIQKADHEIVPVATKLFKEIAKHNLQDVDKMYKGLSLEAVQIKHIREVANTLSNHFGWMMKGINQAMQSQQVEMNKRQILARHPDLSMHM